MPVKAVAQFLAADDGMPDGNFAMADCAGATTVRSVTEPVPSTIRHMHPAVSKWLRDAFHLEAEVAAPLTATQGMSDEGPVVWEHVGRPWMDNVLVCTSA